MPAIRIDQRAVESDSTALSQHPASHREVPFGLITSADWLDFRRPANSRHFVGRADARDRLDAEVLPTGSASGSVVEIKARSGVGKSSLLAVAAEQWAARGLRVELHDARDVKSVADVLALVRRFAGSGQPLGTLEDVRAALAEASSRQGRGIFIVDQFEATFQQPDVFHAYEYVAGVAARTPGIAFVFARKDDLLTTHDEIVVNLERLRGLASQILLQDLVREEALALIRAASAEIQRAPAGLLGEVLEFAQGFPWLIKRTMAHVARSTRGGTSQSELLSGGLRLQDLFEEELGELDENERGYLLRLVQSLPATYQTVLARFEGDPQIAEMLERLTNRRLLRFSAGTYDTYNDVFKDYLLYQRIPERSEAQVYRMGLVSVLRGFRAIGGLNQVSPEELAKNLGRPVKSTYNLLRELRVAGLIVRDAGAWRVPDVVRQYEYQGRLGEYIRQSVLKNRMVSDFLALIEKSGTLKIAEIDEWLKSYFPFIEAKERIWQHYAARLVDWLVRLGAIRRASDADAVILEERPRDEVVRELGNLDLSGRQRRRFSTHFVPSGSLALAQRMLDTVAAGQYVDAQAKRGERQAVRELVIFGALAFDARGILVARMSAEDFIAAARARMSQEPYAKFWALMDQGAPLGDALAEAFEMRNLAPSTRAWLGNKLGNWGSKLGLFERRRRSRKGDTALRPRRRRASAVKAN